MKRKICNYNSIFSKFMAFIIAFIALPNLVGMNYWTRYGWHKPNFIVGIVLTVISLIIYIYNKRYCKEEFVYKCLDCSEVFYESKIKDKRCPYCNSSNLVTLCEYYNSKKIDTSSSSSLVKDIFNAILIYLFIVFPVIFIIHLFINFLASM